MKRPSSMGDQPITEADTNEISLKLMMDRAWKGWHTPVFFAAAAAVIMFVILPFKVPQYTVSMAVVPAPSEQATSSSPTNALSSLLSITGGSQGNNYYLRYQRLLVTPVVAQRMQDRYGMLQHIFSSDWDKKNRKWIERSSLRDFLFGWLLRWSHVPSWTPPDTMTLANFLQDNLLIVPSTENDIVTISMDSSDPAFAKRIMLAAHDQANAVLRDQVARHASQQVSYLQNKIAGVTVADYRATLLAILSSQEKTLMLTQTDAPFAADIVSPPMASAIPVSPRPLLNIALAIIIGALVGTFVVIFFGPNWWSVLSGRLAHLVAPQSEFNGRLGRHHSTPAQ